jgi:hypothetical protein
MIFEIDVTNGRFFTHSTGKADMVGVTLENPLNLKISDSELDALGLMRKPDSELRSDIAALKKMDTPVTDWEVGDYAKCPDGEVRRVVGFEQRMVYLPPFLKFHDSFNICSSVCTRVPKPERPELEYLKWSNNPNWVMFGSAQIPLEAAIAAGQAQEKLDLVDYSLTKAVPSMLRIQAWRKLTREM